MQPLKLTCMLTLSTLCFKEDMSWWGGGQICIPPFSFSCVLKKKLLVVCDPVVDSVLNQRSRTNGDCNIVQYTIKTCIKI